MVATPDGCNPSWLRFIHHHASSTLLVIASGIRLILNINRIYTDKVEPERFLGRDLKDDLFKALKGLRLPVSEQKLALIR